MESSNMFEKLEALLGGEGTGLEAGEGVRNDDEKSNVGMTNDCDGLILSIFISNPASSFPSRELRSLIPPSSLPISEVEEESDEGVLESKRAS